MRISHAIAALAGVVLIISCGCDPYTGDYQSAQEIAAFQTVKIIGFAQTNYRIEHGQYATSLGALGSLIPAGLAPERGGYRYTLQGSQSGFVATAVPIVRGSYTRLSFYEDATSLIRVSRGPEPANAYSPEFGKGPGK